MPKPGFSYGTTVLFVLSFGFIALAGLVNGFGVWKHWYDDPQGPAGSCSPTSSSSSGSS
jgi:hypothetical protein